MTELVYGSTRPPRRWRHWLVSGWRAQVVSGLVIAMVTSFGTWLLSASKVIVYDLVCAEHRTASVGQGPVSTTHPDAPGALPKASADRP